MSLSILKPFTPARIGLERSSHALKTHELLQLKRDLARAHDAVQAPWAWQLLQQELELQQDQTLVLSSQAQTREHYIKRPDHARLLSSSTSEMLSAMTSSYDIAIIISDGLSAHAVEQHFMPLWLLLKPLLKASSYSIAPLCLVPYSRVALSDHLGQALNAQLAIMIIGERPGLSSPYSLGIYLTYHPHPGNSDADRNCISNIHPPEGLSYEQACRHLWHLITQSLTLKLSGIKLIDT